MSQYGQQITVNVASADSPRDLSDNIQARVGVPMEEEPVLYLNGGADNEFMPDDMFEYNEELECKVRRTNRGEESSWPPT